MIETPAFLVPWIAAHGALVVLVLVRRVFARFGAS